MGAGALLLRLAIGTIRANRLTSASCAAPVTVGLLRPRVILPECWSTWPAAQLDAVLTHELTHARRRDPLVQWLALLNRALFWFHPLAWWLERRLTALAEEACDAAVLEHGHDPHDYSEYLLELARMVQRAGMRVNLTGMAMPGSHLPQRIKKIIAGVSASRVSPARMACAVVACAICSAMLAAGTLERVAQIQLPPIPLPVHAPPVLLAQAALPQVPARPAAAATPKFEVVSIKPCRPDAPGGGRGGKGGGPSIGGGGFGSASPGRVDWNCATVKGLIMQAYLLFANGRPNPPWALLGAKIEGGPSWIDSDRYAINVKAEGTPSEETMRGPMLQALLRDRFNLQIRRVTRDIPVYELTVAKGGHKLQPFEPESCTPLDFTKLEPFYPTVPGQKPCRVLGTMKDGIVTTEAQGTSLDLFTKLSLRSMDRPVIDKTGLTGRFNFHLEYAPDETSSPSVRDGGDPGGAPGAAPSAPAGPSIFTAIQQQLGLKLEAAKGPGAFLVIDRVERPTGN